MGKFAWFRCYVMGIIHIYFYVDKGMLLIILKCEHGHLFIVKDKYCKCIMDQLIIVRTYNVHVKGKMYF